MIERTTIQLNETLYRERLEAAAAARRRRATWVAAPGLIAQLRHALGQRLIARRQPLQTLTAPNQTRS